MSKEPSEIAKLTERIAKDPKSKLFVPLAEEYKKAGDIEMAIHVLTEGLKNNPGYVTARSFLGRLLIEQGDFAGAQKEFEEVVKSIPDNLMAQRKLGDLYAFHDRPADALNHYKIALSLNPKDEEIALLITEAESGRDIKQFLHLPQPKSPAPQEQQPDKPVQPKPAAKVPEPKAAQARPVKSVTAEASAAGEHEEPEEVLAVEPLDEPAPIFEEKPSADGMDFLAEAPSESNPEPEREAGGDPFSLDTPFPDSADPSEEPRQALEDPFGLGITAQSAEAGQSQKQQDEKQADDFTTDTLAELYIAQGFFEKAVEIYERMLADKPNSQGLKDKLSKVRAMAASAGTADGPGTEGNEIIPAEAIADFGPETTGPDSSEPDAYIPPEPDAGGARIDGFELPATEPPPPGPEQVRPAKQAPQQNHFDVGFQPREYIPPDAVPHQSSNDRELSPASDSSEGRAGEQTVPTARKFPASRKEETVERLESWLKNIRKEK